MNLIIAAVIDRLRCLFLDATFRLDERRVTLIFISSAHYRFWCRYQKFLKEIFADMGYELVELKCKTIEPGVERKKWLHRSVVGRGRDGRREKK